MEISSQELATLTLLASGVPPDKVTAPLGDEAKLVRDFLVNPARPASTPPEHEARETALNMKQWFEAQRAATDRREAAPGGQRAGTEWDSLLEE